MRRRKQQKRAEPAAATQRAARFQKRMDNWHKKKWKDLRRCRKTLKDLVPACRGRLQAEMDRLKRHRRFLADMSEAVSQVKELRFTMEKVRSLLPAAEVAPSHGLQPAIDLESLQELLLGLGGSRVQRDRDELRWEYYQSQPRESFGRQERQGQNCKNNRSCQLRVGLRCCASVRSSLPDQDVTHDVRERGSQTSRKSNAAPRAETKSKLPKCGKSATEPCGPKCIPAASKW